MQVVVVETGGRPVVVGGDVAVWFGELDEPSTEGQLRVRALDPELVWLAHEHEPWLPRGESFPSPGAGMLQPMSRSEAQQAANESTFRGGERGPR
jgi:N-acyl homoserine lactone hydrolase